MAKIAVRSESNVPEFRRIAAGPGWSVSDVICSAGPADRPFAEQHAQAAIAVVVSGVFEYECSAGRELMTPGSLFLGNAGDCFECGHQHSHGDRCISFAYTPELWELIAYDSGAKRGRFEAPRLPPLRTLASLVAAATGLVRGGDVAKAEELAMITAGAALRTASGVQRRRNGTDPSALARVARVVRMIDNDSEAPHQLADLAQLARLSPYHFLRTFQALIGATPHQYLLRIRLCRAAVRLRTEAAKVSDIALDAGFGDISNFNRTFRAEFGMTPRAYRAAQR